MDPLGSGALGLRVKWEVIKYRCLFCLLSTQEARVMDMRTVFYVVVKSYLLKN